VREADKDYACSDER